ncbi:MAG: hypothetical protein [Caudoviricetes sp.]|nr:MAG: hypothetical protein [Caudoviricetes sp.]
MKALSISMTSFFVACFLVNPLGLFLLAAASWVVMPFIINKT